MTRRRIHPEDDLQAKTIKQLRKLPNVFVFAIPNGGYRTAGDALALKRTGVTAGIPDVAVIHAGLVAFIEFKAPGTIKNRENRHKYCSEPQRHVHRELMSHDCPVLITDDLDEAVAFVVGWAQISP